LLHIAGDLCEQRMWYLPVRLYNNIKVFEGCDFLRRLDFDLLRLGTAVK
jgi:hypothetical protein